MKKCVVIGGGIIGLCSAYYLQKEGHEVIILDQSGMDKGASYVNAGYISPSHIIPLAAPGVVKKGLRWMFDPASPFYVKPRLDLDFLRWAWAFNNSCTKAHVKKAIPLIRDISVLSHELYEDIKSEPGFDFHFEKKGLLMLCKSEKMFEEEIRVAQLAKEAELAAEVLDQGALKNLEPQLASKVVGGTLYKCDSHTTPQEFMRNMKDHLVKNGVDIQRNQEVLDIECKDDTIRQVTTSEGPVKADEYILAAGSWTAGIAKKIEIPLLLQAGKGYSINVEQETNILCPAILAEAKVAVTPMNGFTRFSGTMEIGGINDNVNSVRVNAIAKAAQHYYDDVDITKNELNKASSGLRPLSPDGLPYIGRCKKYENLTIATGHAMMGWTMATGTGKIISELISEKKTSLNLISFLPDRKF